MGGGDGSFPELTKGPPMELFDVIEAFKAGGYHARLMTGPATAGAFEYVHMLIVGNETRPLFSVTAERMPASHGPCFLCMFIGDAHQNLGADRDWTRLEEFEPAALRIASGQLQLQDDWNPVGMRPAGASSKRSLFSRLTGR